MIPGSGRSLEEGNGNPLQYSCLEKSYGRRSLLGYSPQGCKDSDTTERLHFTSLHIVSWAFLVTHLVKNLPAMWETCSIPGLGRSPGDGNGYPLQYSGLQNSMDCRVHGVRKSGTQLSDFHFHLSYCIWELAVKHLTRLPHI